MTDTTRATVTLQPKSSSSRIKLVNQDDFDPLDVFTLPPVDESASDRLAREMREQEAIERSRSIDAELKAAKVAMKHHKKAVKILVLGQSQSGKSTTVKNFQITYAQKSWSEERLAWKSIILLNLVRSVNIMTKALEVSPDLNSQSSGKSTSTERHRSVQLRLRPLRQIEKDLKAVLGACSVELAPGVKLPSDGIQSKDQGDDNKSLVKEFCLRSSSGWKSILSRLQNPQSGKDSDVHRVAWDVVRVCKQDIQWLWSDPTTQRILHERGLRLEDLPGFFLKDVDRIMTEDYEPSDQDILCARLRTTGVQEYHFSMDRANGTVLNWIMYDVAGIRTSRAAWIPYFKDMTALIFLAPLSGFNERLPEDESINRLEDSFALWRTICSSRLLANIQLILFMNKTDILRKKIEQDKTQVRNYIPNYDKPNDFENVAAFFRRDFKKIYIQCTPPDAPKGFISHFTTAVVRIFLPVGYGSPYSLDIYHRPQDSKSTGLTLRAVQSVMLLTDIVEAGLM